MKYDLYGQKYDVIGKIKFKGQKSIPILDIKMMSPEEDIKHTEQNHRNNFIRENGREPDSREECENWFKEWYASLELA